MFVDARSLPDGTRLETDLCIVGAGAAGITLAREFVGGPLRVLLLESGGMTLDADTQRLAEGEVTGLPYFPLIGARLRAFGGTTNHWGAVCRPFEEWDFDGDEGIAASTWPIRLADLRPYYPRAGEVCGLAGFDDLARPASAALPGGLDGAFEPHLVERIPTARRRFAVNYRDEIARARNVTVCLHANVLEIEADEAARQATSVQVATLSHNRFTVAARAFVLAAGGIENARLLLLSRSRRPAGLGNDHDLVGRYFLEHPRFVAGIVLPDNRALPARLFEWRRVRRAVMQTYLRLTPAVRRREGIGQVLVRLEPVYSYGSDIQHAPAVLSLRSLVRSPVPDDDVARDLATVFQDLTTWQRATIPGAPVPVPRPEVVRQALRSSRTVKAHLPELAGAIPTFAYWKLGGSRPVERMRVTTIVIPVPNADSRVLLGTERDALDQPRARLDWRLGARDHRSARRTMEILAAELGRAGAGRLKLLLDRDEQAWPEDLHGGYHHMGTTRMSDDPRTGVVDRRCRVHGVTNLFVAGSSTFPTAGSGTPTLALVALALRLADDLHHTLA
ncbi:MAG TPA: GMC oxidoreductase [Gemmatimonadaceae bacterium]